ncbi:MAG: succinate dehydrogenase cytochrome b subunit [Caldilinea sp.]|mgnify:CR=1 FL=1|nr:succinate dehydrogenase cytochrome b subunit [Caldilinea sp.]MCB0134906.1 succinate dehydrogenase cytochrome b subunit [Caldilineaceae bacterium]MCB0040130.1 succinate dehydrogenase cytochrome b subunit [Caldilinea sp.]MCB0048223.1 succinate dehydrogenase cytochrome b subunit [Caldilinea sp.]MCB0147128.1 succinate dehydrogenase cytochrome b subunit [Caldilineaceae bacterium]
MQVALLPRSSIAKKALMAVTGAVWIGYLALHMWGNLHIFQGQAEFNHYAEFLREVGEPVFSYAQVLWVIRIVIVFSLVAHMWSAWDLFQQARHARSSNYAVKRVVQANYASRFMRIGGVVIILFVLFHLAHYTWGWVTQFDRADPYRNVVIGFSNPIIVLFYLLALASLGLHLFHGVWSMFQTLGFNSRRFDGFFRGLAVFVALVIPLGFATVPLAVMFGFLS